MYFLRKKRVYILLGEAKRFCKKHIYLLYLKMAARSKQITNYLDPFGS